MTRLTLLLILALCAHVHAQSGKLIVAEAPKPATIEGYNQGHCVTLRNVVGIRCAFLVEKEGKTLGTWPANAFLGMTQDFKVMHGDPDGEDKQVSLGA